MTAKIPRYHAFFNPVLRALAALGGSGTIDEIVEKTIELMDLPPEVAEATHGDSDQREVGYCIAWARSYLKKTALLENSPRGVWTLTELGRKTRSVDPDEIRGLERGTRARKEPPTAADAPPEPSVPTWARATERRSMSDLLADPEERRLLVTDVAARRGVAAWVIE